ncbi:MAG: hypothetical protein WCH34_15350, partial [Bacteroidota bacterium]
MKNNLIKLLINCLSCNTIVVLFAILSVITVQAASVTVYPALPGNLYKSDRYQVDVKLVSDGSIQSSYVIKDP